MDKKSLTEQDICTKYITPALVNAGWDIHTQMLEQHYFTDGKIYVRGKLTARAKVKKLIMFYFINLIYLSLLLK
jgi:type I restriction enzyme, R subunit